MTPAEKRRLTWTLIAIFFFFANLIVLVVLLSPSIFGRNNAPSPAPATTHANIPATPR